MARSILIVDKDATRRGQIAAACVGRGDRVREAEDPFSAMAALGQQSFDVLCAYAGPRHLSLRGLFQLAKRKRDDIAIWALVEPADRSAVELSFGGEARIVELGNGAEGIAASLGGDVVAPPAAPIIAEEVSALELELTPIEPAAADAEDALDVDTDDFDVPNTGPVPTPAELAGFDAEFKTPPPGGTWDAGSGDESDVVELDALLSASGEGAPLPSGAETLIAVFARELTGSLVVRDGDRAFRLYLYGGEPAWVDPPGGDAIVFERLVGLRMLPSDARPAPVPEGTLLASLLERAELSRDDAEACMRQLLFDAALEIAGLETCTVEIEEARHFLRAPPPFRVNPFGLVLEARRRRTRPDDLLATSRELQNAPLVASRTLDKVYGKVAPFLRGIDVRSILEHGSTLHDFQEAAGVDSMLATQLVLALEAVGLVRIDRAAVGA